MLLVSADHRPRIIIDGVTPARFASKWLALLRVGGVRTTKYLSTFHIFLLFPPLLSSSSTNLQESNGPDLGSLDID